jgi:hypothetical protein
MLPESPNPFVYALPAVLLVGVVLYFLFGAVDRMGLETYQAEARITDKQFAAGSTTYNTNVVNGRNFTQAYQNPDVYMVTFELDGVPSGGLVDEQLYESLQPGERVHVQFRRTRLTGRVLVTHVSR